MAKLSDFKPQEKNANKHNEYGLTLLERSIQENGWMGAITTAADGETFAGSARLEKLAELMPDKEPIVIETDGATPVIIKRTDIPNAKDKRAVRAGIADNRVQEVDLEWDTDIMGDMIAEDETIFDGLFNEDELIDFGVMDEPESQDAEPQVDRAAELLEKWQVKTGDLWQIGDHRIICGDCTDAAVVERVMGGEKADLCLTDPPYATGGKSKDYDISEEELIVLIGKFLPLALSVSKRILLTPGNKYQFLYPKPEWVLAWFVQAGVGANPWGFTFWNAIFAYGKDPYLESGIGSRPDAFVKTEASEKIGHSTSKPLGVWSWILERGSINKGDIILDPFAGSGTSLVAAENLSRQCRAVEISPAYVAVTLQRMADAFEGIEIKRIE